MKTDILHSLSMKIDTMKLKMNKEEDKKDLAIFSPWCRKKHDKNESPLDIVENFGLYVDKHTTNKLPFLPPLKVLLWGEGPKEPMKR